MKSEQETITTGAACPVPPPSPAASSPEPLPDVLFGRSAALEASGESNSPSSRCYPDNKAVFTITLLDHLLRRPYHCVTLDGPFDAQKLVQDHRHQVFRSETTVGCAGIASIDRLLLCLDHGVFGYLARGSLSLYAPTPQVADAAAHGFRRYIKPDSGGKPHFQVISVDSGGPGTEKVEIERSAPITTEELALNYGADFPSWEEQWIDRMRQTTSGLSILFGPPGCGKTSYLRSVAARLIDTAVLYYVPVSEAQMLSHPRFVTFWASETRRHPEKQKIAILEDAEEMLLPRDAGSRDHVSNLLNIADGFLGDYLKLQIIATTNVPINALDPAIVRPGRLIGMREFRRLNREEAMLLTQAKGLNLPDQRDFSLAELYCTHPGSTRLGNRKPLGFA